MIERIYWVISFQTNLKRFSREIFRSCNFLEAWSQNFIRWTRPYLLLTPFTSGLICVKCCGEGGRFNHFKYFGNHKSYYSIVNTTRGQVLISECKVFCLLQQIFVCEKVIPKNGLYNEIKSPPNPQSPASLLCLILV